MELDRSLEAEEKFREYVITKFPGFKPIFRAGIMSLVNHSYDFSLEPVLGEAIKGLGPSEVFLSNSGEDSVLPFLGFYSFGKENSFILFGTYLINGNILPHVLKKLSRNSTYNGRVGGPELRDLFSNRLSGNYQDHFSRSNFVFRLMPEACPVRGVLLERSDDANTIQYLKSQGWLNS